MLEVLARDTTSRFGQNSSTTYELASIFVLNVAVAKQTTPGVREWKLKPLAKNYIVYCVSFCVMSLMPLEKCDVFNVVESDFIKRNVVLDLPRKVLQM